MDPTHAPLDRLADDIAALTPGDATLPAAAQVVVDLEHLVGAGLGHPARDVVGLARRFSRVHRLLLDVPTTPALLAHLDRQVAALVDPFPALPGATAPAGELLPCGATRGTLRGRAEGGLS